jgi:hypothetical protein
VCRSAPCSSVCASGAFLSAGIAANYEQMQMQVKPTEATLAHPRYARAYGGYRAPGITHSDPKIVRVQTREVRAEDLRSSREDGRVIFAVPPCVVLNVVELFVARCKPDNVSIDYIA